MSIYEVGKCSYCGDENKVLRPSPFMADAGSMMCEFCWDETKEEYKNSNGECIPDFQDNKEDYEAAKNNINPKTDIQIVSEPTWVKLNCPYCDEEIEMDYDEFSDLMTESYPGDWSGEKIECPYCNREIEINDVEWE